MQRPHEYGGKKAEGLERLGEVVTEPHRALSDIGSAMLE